MNCSPMAGHCAYSPATPHAAAVVATVVRDVLPPDPAELTAIAMVALAELVTEKVLEMLGLAP